MNKTETKQKECYEAPMVLEIKPVSTVMVAGASPDDPDDTAGDD